MFQKDIIVSQIKNFQIQNRPKTMSQLLEQTALLDDDFSLTKSSVSKYLNSASNSIPVRRQSSRDLSLMITGNKDNYPLLLFPNPNLSRTFAAQILDEAIKLININYDSFLLWSKNVQQIISYDLSKASYLEMPSFWDISRLLVFMIARKYKLTLSSKEQIKSCVLLFKSTHRMSLRYQNITIDQKTNDALTLLLRSTVFDDQFIKRETYNPRLSEIRCLQYICQCLI